MKLLIVAIMSIFLSGCYEVESGEKVGQIVRLSKGGFLFKTWDVTLIRGGFEDGSGSLGQKFEACVEDDSVREKLRAAMNNKKNIKVKYHQEFFTLFRNNYGGNYFIDEVENFD